MTCTLLGRMAHCNFVDTVLQAGKMYDALV